MLEIEIKALFVVWEDFQDDDNFIKGVDIHIGEKNINGSNLFRFTIISPKYLESMVNIYNFKYGRGLIITRETDELKIEQIINDVLAKCVCDTWSETFNKLSQYAINEYEA